MRRFLHGGQILRRSGPPAILAPVPSLITQVRKSRGLSLDTVAREVGTDPTNLSRVERGTQMPKRELARALFHYFGGVVPLGSIYDPEFGDTLVTAEPVKARRRA